MTNQTCAPSSSCQKNSVYTSIKQNTLKLNSLHMTIEQLSNKKVA